MPLLEPFRIFTRKLEALGMRYAVTGSVAAIYYGEPRLTNDIDIVVWMKAEDATRFEDAFPPEMFYCPPREVIALELAREQRGHFNLIHHETGYKADIYLVGRDEFHIWALTQARVIQMEDDSIHFAPPEYVIVRKLEFFREGGSRKHIRDIRGMLDGLGEDWPRDILLEWIGKRGLHAEWREVEAASD